MFGRLTAWLQERRGKQEERRAKQAAIERAVQTFRKTRGVVPMGGHALSHDSQLTIVRVMYLTDHVPPNRAWYAVSGHDGEVRELSFSDVAHLEGPWR
jgi:hypothetical protein